jgi:hypothetical protein
MQLPRLLQVLCGRSAESDAESAVPRTIFAMQGPLISLVPVTYRHTEHRHLVGMKFFQTHFANSSDFKVSSIGDAYLRCHQQLRLQNDIRRVWAGSGRAKVTFTTESYSNYAELVRIKSEYYLPHFVNMT